MSRTFTALVFFALGAFLFACSSSESEAPPSTAPPPPSAHDAAAPAAPASDIPPYNESAEAAQPFPALMPVERYRDYPVIQKAYAVAHRIPGVIAQQPCYCHCDKFGHKSLLDCFASDHGAG